MKIKKKKIELIAFHLCFPKSLPTYHYFFIRKQIRIRSKQRLYCDWYFSLWLKLDYISLWYDRYFICSSCLKIRVKQGKSELAPRFEEEPSPMKARCCIEIRKKRNQIDIRPPSAVPLFTRNLTLIFISFIQDKQIIFIWQSKEI